MTPVGDYIFARCPAGHLVKAPKRMAGKKVKCQGRDGIPCGEVLRLSHLAAVDEVEIVAEPPKVRFVCAHCNKESTVTAVLAGHVTECRFCGRESIATEREDDTSYSVVLDPEGSSATLPNLDPKRPSDADWCAPGYEKLPEAIRATLDEARGFARQRNWPKAIRRAARVFKTLTRYSLSADFPLKPETLPVRRPLSFCFCQDALADLRNVDPDEVEFSPGFRRLLRRVRRNSRIGVAFEARQCAMCNGPMSRAAGTIVPT